MDAQERRERRLMDDYPFYEKLEKEYELLYDKKVANKDLKYFQKLLIDTNNEINKRDNKLKIKVSQN